MDRAFVFIDGSNFYHKIKELTSHTNIKYRLLDFNYYEFSKWLVKPNDLIEVRYYIGAIKRRHNNDKSEQLYADQQRLLAKLKQQNISFVLGQLIQHPDKTFHEKGVDVRLSVEMIRFARQNKYDSAYLISSDTDLVAAVEEVKSFNKKVNYIGTAKGQSFGLSKISDNIILLRTDDIEQFLPKVLV